MATSPPSGSEEPSSSLVKVPKDKNCPFCGQAFTSSSLGRHLDLYIKPKNPKPPDGVHDVDEIRRMRGNITRRQSRVSSAVQQQQQRRESSTPAAPRWEGESEKSAGEKRGWVVNKLGWEATGVMNDLPPRLDARAGSIGERRERPLREQLKLELDQRQRIADELETGRAAQLALREVLDTVKGAEATATGRHLFANFDFLRESFPSLCLRLLTATPDPNDERLNPSSDTWSSTVPNESQRDALMRIVDERARILRAPTSPLSPAFTAPEGSKNVDVAKFHEHINRVFSMWRTLPDTTRQQVWQREIIRSYARLSEDLKAAQETIRGLRQEAQTLSQRLADRARTDSGFSPAISEGFRSPFVSRGSLGVSDDAVRDLARQGVNVRDWDYERLVERWKGVVREERRSSAGLPGQRSFSGSSQSGLRHQSSNLAVNAPTGAGGSRAASVAESVAMSPAATADVSHAGRNDSMDSGDGEGNDNDQDAEGEDDMEDESVPPEVVQPGYSSHAHQLYQQQQQQQRAQQKTAQPQPHPQQPTQTLRQVLHSQQQQPPPQHMQFQNPTAAQAQQPMLHPHAHINPEYKWPPASASASQAAQYAQMRMMHPGDRHPGPHSWEVEFQSAASGVMEGLEGPAGGGRGEG